MPTGSRIRTLHLRISRQVLYHCATAFCSLYSLCQVTAGFKPSFSGSVTKFSTTVLLLPVHFSLQAKCQQGLNPQSQDLCNGFLFPFLFMPKGGKIRTLNLSISSQVLYHCSTASCSLFSSCQVAAGFEPSNLRVSRQVLYHCATASSSMFSSCQVAARFEPSISILVAMFSTTVLLLPVPFSLHAKCQQDSNPLISWSVAKFSSTVLLLPVPFCLCAK
jgi:hypothetical protein